MRKEELYHFIHQSLPDVKRHKRHFDVDEIHNVQQRTTTLQRGQFVTLYIEFKQRWSDDISRTEDFVKPSDLDLLGRDRLSACRKMDLRISDRKQGRTVVVVCDVHHR